MRAPTWESTGHDHKTPKRASSEVLSTKVPAITEAHQRSSSPLLRSPYVLTSSAPLATGCVSSYRGAPTQQLAVAEIAVRVDQLSALGHRLCCQHLEATPLCIVI